jgi:hypothetical protein
LDKEFIVEIDVSNRGMEAVLMQKGHPIALISKLFRLKQQTLSTYEIELLTILLVITK